MDIGDVCAAEGQFDLAFTIVSDLNVEFYPTATENTHQCDGDEGGGGGGDGGGGVTDEPTPTEEPVVTDIPLP